MRIAYIITRSDNVGGAQVHVHDLARAMRDLGHHPIVLTGGKGPFTDALASEGVPAVILKHLVAPIHPGRDLLGLREIRAALRAVGPDLVSTHSSKAGVLGRIAGRSLGLPVIFTAHGWSFTPGVGSGQAALYRWSEKVSGPLASRIITVSDFDRRLAIDSGIAAANKVVTVHNGMPDLGARHRADPSGDPPRLVMVARFERQKDHRTLIDALAGLRDLPWTLDLVGDGPLVEMVRTQATAAAILDRVRFLGASTRVAEVLSGAQLFLLITNWEGFPRSILEAMRAGLPVIASAVGGVSESVVDGVTGLVVPRGDVAALRGALRRLLPDVPLRVAMGTQGRAAFERQFTLEATVQKTLEVYRQALHLPADRNGKRRPEVSGPASSSTAS